MDDIAFEIAEMIRRRDALRDGGHPVADPANVAATVVGIARLDELIGLATAACAYEPHLGGSGTVASAEAMTEFRAAVERYLRPIRTATFV